MEIAVDLVINSSQGDVGDIEKFHQSNFLNEYILKKQGQVKNPSTGVYVKA